MHEPKRILVTTGPLDMEMMITDVLLELGFDAWTEKEQRDDEVDAIILPSDSIGLEVLERLDKSQIRRAITIVWLLDPLPPPELSAEARQIGERIAGFDWRRLLPGRSGQIVHKYLPFGRDICHFARWNCIRKLINNIHKFSCIVIGNINATPRTLKVV